MFGEVFLSGAGQVLAQILGSGRGASLKQDHLAEQVESGMPVQLSLDLLAVHSTFGTAGTPEGRPPERTPFWLRGGSEADSG
ncbi:hypothetical protein [Streptomyces sp. NBRC 110035]|uniref:hypothetical protein n=1 Tax=Streptomyces sp. NBRC 110035 TaxID=1547867 RepID=UPI00131B5A27|nr:hypothetical protein [Streptomyces sp. NBRC 110035]